MWWCNVFLASGFVRERVTLGDARLAAGLVFPAPMSSLSFFFFGRMGVPKPCSPVSDTRSLRLQKLPLPVGLTVPSCGYTCSFRSGMLR